jgi:hypothetical protein
LSRLAARGDRDICLRRPGARTMVGRSVARGVERVEKVARACLVTMLATLVQGSHSGENGTTLRQASCSPC